METIAMNTTSSPARSDQELIIEFRYRDAGWTPVWSLINRLRRVLKSSGVGTFDGWAFCIDGNLPHYLFMYGPDAEQLLACVRPRLKNVSFLQKRARAILHWGPIFPRSAHRQRIVRLRFTHVKPNRKHQHRGALTASGSSRTRA
jgi:hypothetical protein